MSDSAATTIGITDGSAGMVAQVRALADAMGLDIEMKTISIPKPLCYLPNILFDFLPLLYWPLPPLSHKPKSSSLIISCGRKGALIAAATKRNHPDIKTVHIQDPQMRSSNFDVVVAMEHDKINGRNVIKTRFALHSITKEKLAAAQEKFAETFARYPKPHIAVLLGGTTNKYKFTPARMRSLIEDLSKKMALASGSLLITPSRRTGEGNIEALKEAFAGNKRVYIYDGEPENPYIGMLGCAEKILVTNDSVNMMTEAFSAGKKVEIIPLVGHSGTKPARFANMIKNAPPIAGDEMQKLADEVKKKLFSPAP